MENLKSESVPENSKFFHLHFIFVLDNIAGNSLKKKTKQNKYIKLSSFVHKV